MTTVCDVMTRYPITIDPEAPVDTAIAAMRERGVRHLPVVDDAGRLLGLVSDRDLRSATTGPVLTEWLRGRRRRQANDLRRCGSTLRVRDVMTWGCLTTEGSASLEQAAARMLDRQVGCLLVVLDGRVVGILTERDVVRSMSERLPAIRGDADDYLP